MSRFTKRSSRLTLAALGIAALLGGTAARAEGPKGAGRCESRRSSNDALERATADIETAMLTMTTHGVALETIRALRLEAGLQTKPNDLMLALRTQTKLSAEKRDSLVKAYALAQDATHAVRLTERLDLAPSEKLKRHLRLFDLLEVDPVSYLRARLLKFTLLSPSEVEAILAPLESR